MCQSGGEGLIKTQNGELNKGIMSSDNHCWGTPQYIYDELNKEFAFTLDACADSTNYKHPNYFSEQDNALTKDWFGRVFMNPPYGRVIGEWIKKAYLESQTNAEVVVCLIPARTDTAYWHDYVMKGEIRFIRGRLKFEDGNRKAAQSAPFPSAIVIFGR